MIETKCGRVVYRNYEFAPISRGLKQFFLIFCTRTLTRTLTDTNTHTLRK